MKSIISSAIVATAIVTCLALNVQAKSINHLPAALRIATVSDTGKMDKMGKMKKKKMSKMSKSKMKMSKDTTGKM
jgi:hypothetical protein